MLKPKVPSNMITSQVSYYTWKIDNLQATETPKKAKNSSRLPPLQNNNFSTRVIWGTDLEFFYFIEKLCSVLEIFKFLYF